MQLVHYVFDLAAKQSRREVLMQRSTRRSDSTVDLSRRFVGEAHQSSHEMMAGMKLHGILEQSGLFFCLASNFQIDLVVLPYSEHCTFGLPPEPDMHLISYLHLSFGERTADSQSSSQYIFRNLF